MLVDFAGLPGSGKTTLSQGIEAALQAQGAQAQGLRNLAMACLREKRDTVGFLKNRGERASLWGLCAFAQANPVLYQALHTASARDFKALLWSMESLALLGIVSQLSQDRGFVLNDEGFVQRGAMAFLEDESGYDAYLGAIPATVATVWLRLSPQDALMRTVGRKKGLTALVKGATEAETLAEMTRYDAMIGAGMAALRAKGAAVIEVDATAPLVDAVAQVATQLVALKTQSPADWRWQPVYRERPKDKRRLA